MRPKTGQNRSAPRDVCDACRLFHRIPHCSRVFDHTRVSRHDSYELGWLAQQLSCCEMKGI